MGIPDSLWFFVAVNWNSRGQRRTVRFFGSYLSTKNTDQGRLASCAAFKLRLSCIEETEGMHDISGRYVGGKLY